MEGIHDWQTVTVRAERQWSRGASRAAMTNGSQAENLTSLRVTAKAQREPASGPLGNSVKVVWLVQAGSADPLNLMAMASGHTRHNTVSNDRLNHSGRGVLYLIKGRGSVESSAARQRPPFLSSLASQHELPLVQDTIIRPSFRDRQHPRLTSAIVGQYPSLLQSVSRINSPMSMTTLISHAAALSSYPHYLRRAMARFHSVAIRYERPHDSQLRDKGMSEPRTTPYASSHEVIETICPDTLLRLSHRMTGRERSFLPLRRYSHSSTHELPVFTVLLSTTPHPGSGYRRPYRSIGTAL
ncbi:uncharacterized protein BO96DRAFT_428557 [Aspergillus niger CBS 101883]|uniref:Uncharacterized protein n=3 Tax=Aspergillus niger TaxID=5061 RepID=A2QX72_ASPNC|nr:uncharacterized protein BO96DRAFT_428557 [Aspergillus niger CBS 101883]XP_059604322.1 hypothetical protein An11g07870 [Aspergillus niger]PYH61787.1 hypothetical protein BO96DRAFT_428557 [Aspergillus niger CBS 101883]RDH16412.1 hypothetical protein M747DRAFT_317932 [Aspergillus niger ATCC 13496]CAK45980.1 hypothetical protein An11g07870 [Aspergillus niger]